MPRPPKTYRDLAIRRAYQALRAAGLSDRGACRSLGADYELSLERIWQIVHHPHPDVLALEQAA